MDILDVFDLVEVLAHVLGLGATATVEFDMQNLYFTTILTKSMSTVKIQTPLLHNRKNKRISLTLRDYFNTVQFP